MSNIVTDPASKLKLGPFDIHKMVQRGSEEIIHELVQWGFAKIVLQPSHVRC